MNAIVFVGGKQYSVNEGERIFVEKLNEEVGKEVTFDRILMIKHDSETIVGRPTVKGAKIIATVVKQTRGPRIVVFKKRSKKGYKKTIGHRQYLTELLVKKIIKE